jgi:hypothetical protein
MNRLSHSDSDNDKESKNKKSIIEKSTAKSKEKNVEQGSSQKLTTKSVQNSNSNLKEILSTKTIESPFKDSPFKPQKNIIPDNQINKVMKEKEKKMITDSDDSSDSDTESGSNTDEESKITTKNKSEKNSTSKVQTTNKDSPKSIIEKNNENSEQLTPLQGRSINVSNYDELMNMEEQIKISFCINDMLKCIKKKYDFNDILTKIDKMDSNFTVERQRLQYNIAYFIGHLLMTISIGTFESIDDILDNNIANSDDNFSVVLEKFNRIIDKNDLGYILIHNSNILINNKEFDPNIQDFANSKSRSKYGKKQYDQTQTYNYFRNFYIISKKFPKFTSFNHISHMNFKNFKYLMAGGYYNKLLIKGYWRQGEKLSTDESLIVDYIKDKFTN